jgi:hypothetical protein
MRGKPVVALLCYFGGSLDDTPLSGVRTFATTLRGNAATVSP